MTQCEIFECVQFTIVTSREAFPMSSKIYFDLRRYIELVGDGLCEDRQFIVICGFDMAYKNCYYINSRDGLYMLSSECYMVFLEKNPK